MSTKDELKQHLNTADFLNENFTALESGQKSLEQVTDSILRSNDVGDKTTSLIEANIIANQTPLGNSYLESFNEQLRHDLSLPKDKGVQVLSNEEFSAVKEEMEKFTQTVGQTGAGLAAMPQISKTNFSNLLNEIYYESSILSDCTPYQMGPGKEEVREITNTRVGERIPEATPATYEDNVVDTITINPNIRIVDVQEVTRNFEEAKNSVDAATLIAKMIRACTRATETGVIGSLATAVTPASRTDMYPILNSLAATGTNRGATSVTLTGVGIQNHIDAINYILGEMPINSLEDLKKFGIYANWFTINKILRTMDTNNQYYMDSGTKSIKSLQVDAPMKLVGPGTLANWQILTADMKSYRYKMLRPLRFETNVTSLKDNRMELCVDTFIDGAPINGFKANTGLNVYRVGTLEADGNYAT